ncbi:N-formylglutamate amidohydrolase [Novipirellula herctigrandis]
MTVLISCETGGTRVPSWLIDSITPPQESEPKPFVDQPARYAATRIAGFLGCAIHLNPYASELIDVTRSVRHRNVFPSTARKFNETQRQGLIAEVHQPYRQELKRGLHQAINLSGYVIHVSMRSFALRKDGKLRRTDVGLLYDPSRTDEVDFSLDWIDEMYEEVPMVRVRRNYPRRGTTESIVTAMRSEFSAEQYIGIEVLLNRAWVGRPLLRRDEAIDGMCRSLALMAEVDLAPQSFVPETRDVA